MTNDLREDGELNSGDTHSDYAGALTSIPEVAEIDALLPDYEVQAIIGQGGMGAVYKAWQPKLERFVAIKVLSAGAGGELNFAESFRTEARTMANLKHSNIAAVYDFGEAGGYLYLVMEYVDGSTLFDLIHANALTADQIMTMVHQVCDALTYAHSQNVIHRDIKSANILIGSDAKVKVVDFGLATLQAAPQLLKRQVNDAPIMGTIGCSAPEILKPGSVVDQRADVYSLGVVLYEALTKRTMETPWVSPARAAGTPPQLDGVILKATKVDPTERYQSVEQFEAGLKQLAKFSSSATAKRKPAVAVAAARQAMPRKSAESSMPMIIGVVAIVLVVVLFFMLSGKKKEAATRSSPIPVDLVVPSDVDTENWEPKPVNKTEIPAPVVVSKTSESDNRPDPVTPVVEPKVTEQKSAGLLAAERLLAADEADAAKIYQADVAALLGKYAVALEKSAVSDAANSEAYFEEKELIENQDFPESDAPGLLPKIADLRHTMRLERHKLRVVEAEARIKALSSHIDRLKALSSQDTQVLQSIREAARKMRELQGVSADVPVR